MKATYKSKNGRLLIEVTGETQKDIFAGIAGAQEVFEADECCGACLQDDIKFQVRHVDPYTYYELVCKNPTCRARLSFGQNVAGGTLFPKRKDKEQNWIENNGWEVYKPGAQS